MSFPFYLLALIIGGSFGQDQQSGQLLSEDLFDIPEEVSSSHSNNIGDNYAQCTLAFMKCIAEAKNSKCLAVSGNIIDCALALMNCIENTDKLGNPDEWGEHYQGDIILPLPGILKNGLIDVKFRWPNGVVPYEFDQNFQSFKKPIVHRAMQDYYHLTAGCINFVQRTNQNDYIIFTGAENGCYSYVGRIGGKQNINYASYCLNQYGTVLHEMYHALGFMHEQSRTDRDNYVTIMLNNIKTGYEHNFDKYDAHTVTPFGFSYDYMSVMHYSQYAFTKNNQPTIITKDPAYQNKIGQRTGLSPTDLGKLKAMYKCP